MNISKASTLPNPPGKFSRISSQFTETAFSGIRILRHLAVWQREISTIRAMQVVDNFVGVLFSLYLKPDVREKMRIKKQSIPCRFRLRLDPFP
jgi:hypothetical protein